MGPAGENARQPAGDQVGIDRVGRVEPEGIGDVRGVERAEDHVVGPAEERPVVGGQALHHVDVAPEQ
jgi:hypothetical protein